MKQKITKIAKIKTPEQLIAEGKYVSAAGAAALLEKSGKLTLAEAVKKVSAALAHAEHDGDDESVREIGKHLSDYIDSSVVDTELDVLNETTQIDLHPDVLDDASVIVPMPGPVLDDDY